MPTASALCSVAASRMLDQRLLDAEIDHAVAVVGQDDVDQVLADVVHVALHGGEDDRTLLLALDPLHQGLEIGHGLLHRLGRLQHEGQLHLAGAEQLAHGLHAVEQDVVDDRERRVALQGCIEIGFEPLLVAVDDPQLELLLDRLGSQLGRAGRGFAVGEQGHERVQRVVAVAAPVEDQVLGGLDLFGRDLVQRHDLAAVDDGPGEAAAHGVVEHDRVEDVPGGGVEAEGDVGQAQDQLQLGKLAADVLDRLQGPQGELAVVLVAGADREGERVEQQVRHGQAEAAAGELDQAAGDRGACPRATWPCRPRRWSAR